MKTQRLERFIIWGMALAGMAAAIVAGGTCGWLVGHVVKKLTHL